MSYGSTAIRTVWIAILLMIIAVAAILAVGAFFGGGLKIDILAGLLALLLLIPVVWRSIKNNRPVPLSADDVVKLLDQS